MKGRKFNDLSKYQVFERVKAACGPGKKKFQDFLGNFGVSFNVVRLVGK
jgi:hypothetical protein